eukprot:TRINITY_DN116_c0_g1_i7.p1 TRINITY_DN116_c0_g1~~TRINITY_DN116_c0_g1_i7.p1  ORF type:complete len:215 (+),score=71.02 TRINITY_DN116_c0_g1_i7:60-704(+)
MNHLPVIVKTVVATVALVLLLVVLGTPSLYKFKIPMYMIEGEGLGVFKTDIKVENIEIGWLMLGKAHEGIGTTHKVMQGAVITAVVSIGLGVVTDLVGHFASVAAASTIGMVFGFLQISGATVFVATIVLAYASSFSQKDGYGDMKLSKGSDLWYGFYLSCVALVMIFVNQFTVSLVKKCSGGETQSFNNYNRYNEGNRVKEEEMGRRPQTMTV